MTVALVAAGVVAKKMIGDVVLHSRIVSVGGCQAESDFDREISEAVAAGDSVGGIVEVTADNVTAGTGEPFFDSVESEMAHILFSIPAVKGVEFGCGFAAAHMHGSEYNDVIVSADGRTATNHDGGIAGGIANGNQIVVRVAVKPTPSISMTQRSFNPASGRVEEFRIRGRHDACIALRFPVIAEAAVAIALADLMRKQFQKN